MASNAQAMGATGARRMFPESYDWSNTPLGPTFPAWSCLNTTGELQLPCVMHLDLRDAAKVGFWGL